MTPRWSVRYRRGRWLVYGPHSAVPYEDWPTLPEAHTAATQFAYADTLFAPGGITCVKHMKAAYEDWADWTGTDL